MVRTYAIARGGFGLFGRGLCVDRFLYGDNNVISTSYILTRFLDRFERFLRDGRGT